MLQAAAGVEPAQTRNEVAHKMTDALAAQRAGDRWRAEAIYRDVIARAPEQPDALHMLGVLRFEQGDLREAARLILRALDLTGWKFPLYRYNLGLVVAQGHRPTAERDRDAALERGDTSTRSRRTGGHRAPPVAVVIPSYNHARFVARAIASAFAQTYRPIELIVIDDGSTDGSTDIVRNAISDAPVPCRFVARERRGATATINEGIDLSTTPYINVLNSDDFYPEDRIAQMVEAVVGSGAEWGFSAVTLVDDRDQPISPLDDERVAVLMKVANAVSAWATVGFSLLSGNATISSGNLFCSRDLWRRLGGFSELRYNHDWDFALRALRVAEPAYVASPGYCYRLHESNTIRTAIEDGGVTEMNTVLKGFFAWASRENHPVNPLAPSLANWGMYFSCMCLSIGWGPFFEEQTLRRLASMIDDGEGERAAVAGTRRSVGTIDVLAEVLAEPTSDAPLQVRTTRRARSGVATAASASIDDNAARGEQASALLIADSDIPTTHLVARELRQAFASLDVRIVPDLPSEAPTDRPVVVSRLCFPRYSWLPGALKREGVRYAYFLDDNFWEITAEIDERLAQFFRHPATIDALDAFVRNAAVVLTWSAPLRDYVAARFPGVAAEFVNPGFDVTTATSLLKGGAQQGGARSTALRIGYPSTPRPSVSPLIDAIVRHFLREHGEVVTFEFIGWMPEHLRGLPNVVSHPWIADYDAYLAFKIGRRWDIGIAPLVGNAFEGYKTANKYREYGGCRIPGVYSDVAPFRGTVDPERTGILAGNDLAPWVDALERLVAAPRSRAAIADAAFDDIARNYDLRTTGRRLGDTIIRHVRPAGVDEAVA